MKKVFLSISFKEEDRKVNEFFKNLLLSSGLEPVTAEPEDAPKVLEKIFPKIDDCEIFCAIFVTRHKTTEGYFLAPPKIIHELGHARSRGKPIIGFVEKGINRDELGLISYEGKTLPEFDRANLESKRKGFEHFIKTQDFFKELPSMPFYYRGLFKDITIYSDGYSVVRQRYRMVIKSQEMEANSHHFDLRPSVIKGLIFPKDFLIDPQYSEVTNRWKRKPFFKHRLCEKVDFDESKFTIVPKKSPDEKRVDFNVKFPRVNVGSEICYEWAIGFPNLFPTSKEELARGKREEDEDEAISCLRIPEKIEDFAYVLRFEGTPVFYKEPTFLCYYGETPLQCPHTQKIIQKSTLYTNYVLKTDLSDHRYSQIELRWIPK